MIHRLRLPLIAIILYKMALLWDGCRTWLLEYPRTACIVCRSYLTNIYLLVVVVPRRGCLLYQSLSELTDDISVLVCTSLLVGVLYCVLELSESVVAVLAVWTLWRLHCGCVRC